MSGGSWNYAYRDVSDLSGRLLAEHSVLRRAFGTHLADVARALHDIEWVDSADKSPGEEEVAIRACLRGDAEIQQSAMELRLAVKEAEELLARLRPVCPRCAGGDDPISCPTCGGGERVP